MVDVWSFVTSHPTLALHIFFAQGDDGSHRGVEASVEVEDFYDSGPGGCGDQVNTAGSSSMPLRQASAAATVFVPGGTPSTWITPMLGFFIFRYSRLRPS